MYFVACHTYMHEQVRLADQQKINEFGRLNTRLQELREDKMHVKVKKKKNTRTETHGEDSLIAAAKRGNVIHLTVDKSILRKKKGISSTMTTARSIPMNRVVRSGVGRDGRDG